MLDISFLELVVVGVVALLVLGPQRLPAAARTTGLWIGKIKRTVSGMQREINAQFEAEELRQKLNEQQKKLDESLTKVKRDVEQYAEPDAAPSNTDDSHADQSEITKGETEPGGDKPAVNNPTSSDKDASFR